MIIQYRVLLYNLCPYTQLKCCISSIRFERLVELANQIAWDENKKLIGKEVEVLISTVEGKKNESAGRVSGRARDNRLVNVTKVDTSGNEIDIRPGDIVTAELTYAAPYHLNADNLISVRKTRAGDNFEAGSRPSTPGVMLGMPKLSV
jgi:tRNA-2-methylthio-N6-dimethylallyladenosine synthase